MVVSGDWNRDLAQTIGVGCQDGPENLVGVVAHEIPQL
jgi:hypothetical protein